MGWSVYWVWLLIVIVVAAAAAVEGGDVTYDRRSLIIDGKRSILFSGSIHYPRSTPDMWPSLISKAKEGGLQVIQTYVFWNLHEPQPGQYDFSGRRDIVRFIKEIQAQGLYVSLRIGPFIEGEWNYGGLPFWIHDVPGIVYRSDNEPFKQVMQNFTTKIVNMMKSEGLYASQGGPIILSQIENEYKNVEASFREKGPPYVRWAAKMAVGLQTGVPWMMCKQDDAPDPVINTCNGRQCGETFVGPNSPNKPSLWTENWTSFLQAYGKETPIRSVEDIAFHATLFIATKNGSFINYYMYHGGTNLGRTGSAYMITGYYDQAPLDEYGLIRQPKWGHLKELHAAVNQCSDTILSGDQTKVSLGQNQEAYIYQGKSGECAALLVNSARENVIVQFENTSYQLPAKSISILPDCKKVAFNTATVNTQFNSRSIIASLKLDSAERWEVFSEAVPEYENTSIKANTLLEHANTTKDMSDYLWYTFRFHKNFSDSQPILNVNSLAHVLHAYVNGIFAGSAHGTSNNTNFTLTSKIQSSNGMNSISLLSVMVGLPDSGAFLERRFTGLRSVSIQDEQTKSYTNYSWGYQVGLLGEKLQVYTSEGSSNVQWNEYSSSDRLTWYKDKKVKGWEKGKTRDITYLHRELVDSKIHPWIYSKTTFDAPEGSEPVTLNLGSMGKGEAWVNGQSIGRYWVSYHTPEGLPSQTWYHVPRSFLKPTGNLLVLLDEDYGNPLGISIDTFTVTKVSARASSKGHKHREA